MVRDSSDRDTKGENDTMGVFKPTGQRKSATILIKLRALDRAKVERVAEREQTSMSHVIRQAIARDMKRRGQDSDE